MKKLINKCKRIIIHQKLVKGIAKSISNTYSYPYNYKANITKRFENAVKFRIEMFKK